MHLSLLKSPLFSRAADVCESHNVETITCKLRGLNAGFHVSGMSWITSLTFASANSDASIFVLAPWDHSAPCYVLKSHPKLLSFRMSRNGRMCASGHSGGKVCLIKMDCDVPLCWQ